MQTIAEVVKKFYGITGSGSTNKLTTKAKAACGFADIPTRQLKPEQFDKVRNWLKNDAIAKGNFKADVNVCDENTLYAHETPPTPSESNLTSVQTQDKPRSMIKGAESVRFTIRFAEGKGGRKDVFIERPFSDALNHIMPDDKKRSQWLVECVRTAGEQNPASFIRCSVVDALFNRVIELEGGSRREGS